MNLIANPFEAPANYTEFYEQYFPYTQQFLIKHRHIDPNEVEDMAQEIMVRCVERDVLAMFDPNREIEYNGEKRAARFKSFMNAFLGKYGMGLRDTYQLRNNKYALIFDSPAGDESDAPSFGETFLSQSVSAEEAYFMNSESPAMAGLREHLSSKLVSNPRFGRCKADVKYAETTYWDIFRIMAAMANDGKKSWTGLVPLVAEKYGVSTTAASEWQKKVRLEAEKFLQEFVE